MTPANPSGPVSRTVIVLGAGLVGAACAWHLQRLGHQVTLVDPGTDPQGSRAALGVLMGQVFHRSSGRGWRLRQRSLELWGRWRRELAERGLPLPWREGLLLLADTADTLERQRRLVEERRRRGLPLELWEPQRLADLSPALPAGALGALHSPLDGQLDPMPALEGFLADGEAAGLAMVRDRAVGLEPRPHGWRVRLEGGTALEAAWVVLSAGCGVGPLLEALGVERPIEPVLGQALELELPPMEGGPMPWNWPGTVVWQGRNLILRRSPGEPDRLWLGATVEPGTHADPAALAALRDLDGAAPDWLRRARVVRQWHGIRPRPVGRPAPLLEAVAPGLLLVAGHHRNGVLLAPASADWVADQLAQA